MYYEKTFREHRFDTVDEYNTIKLRVGFEKRVV